MYAIRRILLVAVAAALVASVVPAQVNPGDYILGELGGKGLFSVDRTTGAVNTVTTVPSGNFVNWVAMDFNNRDIMAVAGGGGRHLFRVSPTGTKTSIAVVHTSVSPSGIELDEDGTYLVSGSNSSSISILVRVSFGGSVTSVLSPVPNSLNGIAIDRATGDYLLPLWKTGELQRMNRQTRAITTLAQGMNYVSAVDFEPRTGDYAVTSFNPRACFLVRASGGIAATITASGYDQGVKVDDETGTLHLAGFSGIREVTRTGTVIRTHTTPGFRWTSLDIYASRKVSGFGSAKAGSTYTFNFSFPTAGAGAMYVGALSITGLQPGVSLPDGRQINLAFDDLARLMLMVGDIPGLTSGFRGTLGTNASALATVKIPAGFPAGIRIFATAVAISTKAPLGLETGDTWAFTTR